MVVDLGARTPDHRSGPECETQETYGLAAMVSWAAACRSAASAMRRSSKHRSQASRFSPVAKAVGVGVQVGKNPSSPEGVAVGSGLLGVSVGSGWAVGSGLSVGSGWVVGVDFFSRSGQVPSSTFSQGQ